jgi:RHH-type proline utilization regulon transcriptional repressor/proline dehydrogenase/delta 1-pyrroline-5-carboxylate dehydrogenase
LENGAKTSFVNRLNYDSAPIEKIIADPIATLRATSPKPHPRIPLPRDIYGSARLNSLGIDLSDERALRPLADEMADVAQGAWRSVPLIGGKVPAKGSAREILDPSDHRRVVGEAIDASVADADRALAMAHGAQPKWDALKVSARARILETAADLFEENRAALMARVIREGGKSLSDAVAEVREAADYCRYYAAEARRQFVPQPLPGPTGEDNALELHGRGVFACISPWNFPLAIFTGQVVAALAAGNAVVAKPAEQTPLTAALAIELLHRAGVPPEILHFVPGPGRTIGSALVVDRRTAGVVFTGSTEVAHGLAKTLANREGPIVPLIAETGGQNAMVVDSSALPEQVVADIITSSFLSAGQRCSSLRVLFVQDDIADKLLTMLAGASAELVIGDPALLSTDIGPVIDDEARKMLEDHAVRMGREGKLLFQVPLPKDVARHGSFFAPRAFAIPSLALLKREVFGPILHVVRWQAGYLDKVADAVAATGYGLTLGIHSRIAETVTEIRERLGVGNTYVNRNMIGAVVGVQPFGGEGLSGTGPKAGGPHYLPRFALERTLTINTTAAGGNASLLTLDEN